MAKAAMPAHDKPVPSPSAASGRHVRELDKRFEVLKVLGKGSYGTAFKARRRSDNKLYAVKEADVEKMSAVERADAVNEIRLLASIKHENVCRYHEAFLDGNHLCIVMSFAPNGDLARWIRKGQELRKAMPEDIIWKYLTEICLGLYVLHTNKILHRDIKAANVFVGENDRIMLGDLGIAKLAKTEGLAAKTQIGTPHYMAPEIWMDRPYGPPADTLFAQGACHITICSTRHLEARHSNAHIWAVGCLLYELCNYRVPFEGENMHDLRSKVCSCSYRPITTGKYSKDLIDLVGSLLVLNPHKRHTLITVFQLPQVQAKLAKLPQNQLAFMPPDVLKTIQVPHDLRQLSSLLPAADYREATELCR